MHISCAGALFAAGFRKQLGVSKAKRMFAENLNNPTRDREALSQQVMMTHWYPVPCKKPEKQGHQAILKYASNHPSLKENNQKNCQKKKPLQGR
jgi:hypothetical protein